MVATLTEEAVNAACLGFDRNRVPPVDAQAAHNGHVVVTLDIEKAFSTGWSLGIAAGAWKRVIMNLVSNALKYTPSGYVRVNLHRGSSTRDVGKDKISLIHLSVEDSGVGMSASFQRESLFRAFHQENSIVAGTGLVRSQDRITMLLFLTLL
jgi:signal transduction histidine kinase